MRRPSEFEVRHHLGQQMDRNRVMLSLGNGQLCLVGSLNEWGWFSAVRVWMLAQRWPCLELLVTL